LRYAPAGWPLCGSGGRQKHKIQRIFFFNLRGGNICNTLGYRRYVADLTESREIYIPHLFDVGGPAGILHFVQLHRRIFGTVSNVVFVA